MRDDEKGANTTLGLLRNPVASLEMRDDEKGVNITRGLLRCPIACLANSTVAAFEPAHNWLLA